MDQEAVRNQIDRILQSATFADKNQLRKLLQILSDRMDSQRTLKPDRIIRELWSEQNGAKGSADVAAEIYRLRHALYLYYKGEGQNDPIIVSLPKRAPAADRVKDKRWIAAELRSGEETQEVTQTRPWAPAVLVTATKSRIGLKALAGIAIAAIISGYIMVRVYAIDEQPNAGRLEGASFVVVNEEGKELWRKSFSDGFWSDYYQKGLATRAWFGDLDGDGHNSVLLLYQPAVNATGRSTTLICFSNRGEEKWRWTPGRALPELGNEPAVFQSDRPGGSSVNSGNATANCRFESAFSLLSLPDSSHRCPWQDDLRVLAFRTSGLHDTRRLGWRWTSGDHRERRG